MRLFTKILVTLGSFFYCTHVMSQVTWEPDVGFIENPPISNIMCGDTPTNALYTLKNFEEVGIIIDHPDIIRFDNFPDSLVAIEEGGLTTCKFGSKLAGGATCHINLLITPQTCGLEPTAGPILRILHVAVDTLQVKALAGIYFRYLRDIVFPPSPPPADKGFAVLGLNVSNTSGGIAQTDGSVGCTGSDAASDPCVAGGYDIINGELYSYETSPVTQAQTEYTNLYNTFQYYRTLSGCTLDSNLDDGDTLNSGYYCLSNKDNTNVTVDGLIYLRGDRDFVFFIDTINPSCFTSSAPPLEEYSPCNLTFLSNTRFIYLDGASAANVYWVVGQGNTKLSVNAVVDGTILSYAGPITGDPSGNTPALVNGSLWSNENNITLYGNTVAVP